MLPVRAVRVGVKRIISSTYTRIAVRYYPPLTGRVHGKEEHAMLRLTAKSTASGPNRSLAVFSANRICRHRNSGFRTSSMSCCASPSSESASRTSSLATSPKPSTATVDATTGNPAAIASKIFNLVPPPAASGTTATLARS